MDHVKHLFCLECGNDVYFLELNIVGYVANFETKPSCTVTNAYPYEKSGIFCGVCFDEGHYVQVGEERLSATVVEQALYEGKRTMLQ